MDVCDSSQFHTGPTGSPLTFLYFLCTLHWRKNRHCHTRKYFSMAGQWCYSTHGWHVNWWWGVCETWQRGGRRVHIYLRYRSLCKRIFTGKCAASVGRTSCNMAAVGEGRPKACQWLDEIAWEEPRPACQFRYNRLLHTIRSGIMSNSKWFNPNSMQLMWRNILNW